MVNILYIHGMGGGADSRIPSILSDWFSCQGGACCDFGYEVSVICRTYSFDPQFARHEILEWVEELKPVLVIGESLGACHALRLKSIPHIFVSPAPEASYKLGRYCSLVRIPFVKTLMEYIFKVRQGDRQKLDFSYDVLKKYKEHYSEAISSISPDDYYFAFFGAKDHYMKSGIVDVRKWEKLFGKDSYSMYDGSHYMEEEYIYSLLIPKISDLLLSLLN